MGKNKTKERENNDLSFYFYFSLTPKGRRRHKVFSLASALTLSWSIVFSHTFKTKSPKCWSNRFLGNVKNKNFIENKLRKKYSLVFLFYLIRYGVDLVLYLLLFIQLN